MGRRKKKILILVEHAARELESACLLKYEFEKRNCNVKILNMYPNKEVIPFVYYGDIVIFPWIYNTKRGNLNYPKCFLWKNRKTKLISLHQEQFSPINSDDFLIPKGEAKKVIHISWGQQFTDKLLESGCKTKDVFTVGNIRLDFYKNKLKKYFYSKKELGELYGIDADKKWVLYIADSFHLIENYQIKNLKNGNNEFVELMNIGKECRKDFLEYASKYIQQNDQVAFIYRPHPSYENKDKVQKDLLHLSAKFPKQFFVISELSIGNWIVNADICMSFQSTSIIECCVGQIPYYLFRSRTLPVKYDYDFFVNYKYIIRSYNEFCNIIVKPNVDYIEFKNEISKHVKIDEEYTYKKIVELSLNNEEEMEITCDFFTWLKNCFKASVKQLIIFSSNIKLFRNILISRNDNRYKRLLGNCDDVFTDKQVDRILAKIQFCLK